MSDNARVAPNTGAMTFSVPIELPAGFAGASPGLALTYSSFGGDGPVGIGWDLPVRTIERTTARALPTYTTADEFAFGGDDPLVALPDAGTGVAEYRARFERAFIRFRWYAQGDGSAGYWTAETPDGSVTYYGADETGALVSSARLASVTVGKGTFRYYPVVTVDRFGHKLAYAWAAEPLPASASAAAVSVPLLRSLSWVFVQGQPAYQATFTYGDRMRVVSDCDPAFETLLTKQLVGVTVTAHGKTRRAVALTYEAAASSGGQTRLARVESAGADGTKDPLVFSFGYSQSLGVMGCADASCKAALVEMPLVGVNPDLTAGHTTLVDLNGDALPDVVDTTGPKHKILLSKLGADGQASFLPVTTSAFGDGYDLKSADVQVLDVDGDGFVDILHAAAGTYLANGGAANGDWTAEKPLATASTTLAQVLTGQGANARFLDVDGDHQIDLLHLEQGTVNVYRNAGAAGFVAQAPISVTVPGAVDFSHGLALADMNGDGQQDLVQVKTAGLTYWLGLGFGNFGPAVDVALDISLSEVSAVELQDLNGDQLDDVVIVQGNQVKYALNRSVGAFDPFVALTGASMGLANLPTVTAQTTVLFADMNGNGSTDVVWVDAGAGKLTYLELFPLRPNLLTHVDNGLGLVTDIGYSTTLAQQGRAAAPWMHRLPHAMTVVGELKRTETLGAATEDELYAYTDAYYDPLWKQFRGFSQVETLEEADPNQEAGHTTLAFDLGDTDPYRAGLLTKQVLESAGRTLSSEAHAYDDCTIDGVPTGSPVRFVCEKAKTTTLVEGRPAAEWVTTESHYDYDHNGNVSLESHLGVTAVGGGACGACASLPAGLTSGACGPTCAGDELTVETQYAAPGRAAGTWLLGAPVVEKVYGPVTGPVSERHTFYDGDAFVGLPAGKLDKGVVTRVEVVSTAAGDTVQQLRNRVDADGNVVERIDALGAPGSDDHRATMVYDPSGLRVVSTTIAMKDAAGAYELRRATAYDPIFDEPSSETSWALWRGGAEVTPASSTTLLGYDGLGRLVAQAETPSTLDAPDRTLAYEYGAPPSRVIVRARSQAGGALDLETVRCLDGKGRVFQERTQVAAGRFLVSGHTTYNTRDAIVSSYQPYEGATDACDATPPADGRAVATFRDAAERELATVLPDGAAGTQSTSRHEYGPLSVVMLDENDTGAADAAAKGPRTETYDGLGHILTSARAGDPTGPLVHRFLYDGLGRLSAVGDAAGFVRQQQYDLLGRPVSATDADTGTTTYAYDDLGNRTRRVDARGVTTDYAYDGLERLVGQWTDGAEATTRVSYAYDVAPAACGDRCPNVVGHVAAITYPIGTGAGGETYGYDPRGRATRFSRSFAPTGAERAAPDLGTQRFDFTLAHDNVGRLASGDYPGGLHVAYAYDGGGRVTGVPGLLTSVVYTARGDLQAIGFANGITTTYDADNVGALAGLHTKDAHGTPIVSLTYERDREGHIVTIHDGAALPDLPSASATYTYDPLDRLVSATLEPDRPTSPFAETLTYTYDASDDVVSRTSSLGAASAGHLGALAYDPAHPHRVTKAGARAFDYDAAGNTTARGGDTLRWDDRGRLAAVARGGADVASYFYGASRDRLVKVEDGHRVLALAPDFDVRDGHGVFTLRLGDTQVAKVETPALAATVLSDVAPATLAGTAATPAPDGAITAGDAWLAQASAAGVLDLGAAQTSDVDALLASAVRRALVGDGTKTTFLHVDHEGSVVAATDMTGAVTYRASYYPHGDLRASSGVAPPEDLRYTGKERDEASGLVAFGARYADLETGRFLSLDPHFELLLDPEATDRPDEATSRYGFAAGDPVNRVDRDGRFAWWAFGMVVGAATSMVTEIWRQVQLDGKITSGRDVLVKGALGLAFGGLTAGFSAISTVAAAKVEVAAYRRLKKAAEDKHGIPLSAEEERSVRKKAAWGGFFAGAAVGVGSGFAQGAIEQGIASAMGETTFSHGMNGNVEAWMSSNQGQLTELAVEGAADRGIELAEAVVEKVQEHREKQRMSRYKPVYKRRPTPMPHNRAHYHGSFAVRR